MVPPRIFDDESIALHGRRCKKNSSYLCSSVITKLPMIKAICPVKANDRRFIEKEKNGQYGLLKVKN
jgi:hypothetical protein